VLLVLVAGAAATWWDGDGTQYDTKVWVVDHDGAPWVRVVNPGRHARLIRIPVRLDRDPAGGV
jgi:hypothetical protein